MKTCAVTMSTKGIRFIEGYPGFNTISEVFEENVSEKSEIIDDERICEAAKVLNVLREIPMVKCNHRLDSLLE